MGLFVCTVQRGVWPLLAHLQLHTPAGCELTSAEEYSYVPYRPTLCWVVGYI